ncbi:kinase-like protein [Aspergillus pseudoustus]|uniref:Kinase-like protein n=1 Tax=Aspergillus pseudoustus TaxID=1810923 RepID=A0ABR4IJF0_9EURO
MALPLTFQATRIIRISDHQVVKWGPDITREEAENQKIACKLVDTGIVRIPRVYGFFTDERGWGYIVMEFTAGKIIDPLEDTAAIERVADVLDHFATLGRTVPGPLSRGLCRGLLFPETEDLRFDGRDEMERWFNSRLFEHNPKLCFRSFNLVFCHLDIALRDLLWQEDGSLCLLDWASAGYYPRLFEFCAQLIIEGKDGKFNSIPLDSMKPLSDEEAVQKESVLCAWRNMQKYAFRPNRLQTPTRALETSTNSIHVPPPPMPDYPPEWSKENQRQYSTQRNPHLLPGQTRR